MSDDVIHSQLAREPRPVLPPFFASRVAAHAAAPRHRGWMRAYWLLSSMALIAIFRIAGLPEPAWRVLAALLTPVSAAILLLDAAKLRRLAQIFLTAAVIAVLPAGAQHTKMPKGYRLLFNGKNLDGWESRGDGKWSVLSDGTLAGQRIWDRLLLSPGKTPLKDDKAYRDWLNNQAWLYTNAEFGDFDLHVEFWTKTEGNSGISIRDTSRGEYGISKPPDFNRTPSKIGYEIQINNQYPDPTPTGSVYTFTKAPKEAMMEDDWNSFDIEVRNGMIRVKLNGKLVSEMKADPKRPVRGPIGLQLHDQFSIVQFRNLWIKE
ncbi:MAG: DUF1080 domain-containing protein [Bryobacterales bacterium]|nr:DUF1080 domain-containing protein [Bryobacterales bacterium]